MKITGNPEAAGAGSAVADTSQAKPRSRFSKVLKDEKQRTTEAPGKDGDKRETADPEKPPNSVPMTPRKLLEMRRCPWSRPWRKSQKTAHDVYGVDPAPCAKRVATPTPRGLCTGARGDARVRA